MPIVGYAFLESSLEGALEGFLRGSLMGTLKVFLEGSREGSFEGSHNCFLKGSLEVPSGSKKYCLGSRAGVIILRISISWIFVDPRFPDSQISRNFQSSILDDTDLPLPSRMPI